MNRTWIRRRIAHHCQKCTKLRHVAYWIPGWKDELRRYCPMCVVKVVKSKSYTRQQPKHHAQICESVLARVAKERR